MLEKGIQNSQIRPLRSKPVPKREREEVVGSGLGRNPERFAKSCKLELIDNVKMGTMD